MNDLTIAEIYQIYRLKGDRQYDDEAVSQLEHALQCATLAAGHSAELRAAAFLHDFGHLWGAATAIDRHEDGAISALRRLFSDAVTEPIRLHVKAKRYLCAIDRTYWSCLSPASQRSLIAQGSIFSDAEAKAFIAQPHASAAVQLRRWDDRAKMVGSATLSLHDLAPILHQLEQR